MTESVHDRSTREIAELRDKVLVEMLRHVPFDGWTARAMSAAEESGGLGEGAAYRAFPDGLADAAAHASDYFDRLALARLDALDLASMKVRERIAAGVRARIEVMEPYREAVRRLLGFMALPTNKTLSWRLAWQTCSRIWYAAGDDATDFNHYTKRGLLFPVYTTTTLYWLSDESDGHADSWDYLERRIADVLKIPGYQAKAKKALGRLPNPLRVFERRAG